MMTASEIVSAIDGLHPIERERLCECLSIGEASTSLLLHEIESRYDAVLDCDEIAAMAKRIVGAEAEFWEQHKPPPRKETAAPGRAAAEQHQPEPLVYDGATAPDRSSSP